MRPGSAILTGNQTSGEWHGGCGFKVLGGNSTMTEFHENIHLTNCGVIDTNMTYGSYPTGHGVNNFTPYLIIMAKNVHMDGCWTKAVNQAAVARNGVLITAVDGIFLNDCSIRDADLTALKPFEETPVAGFPGADNPVKNLVVNGGLFEVVTTTAGQGLPFWVGENAAYAHENWTISGAVFKGGTGAVRIETPGAGSYKNINMAFTYVGTIADDDTAVSASILGGGSPAILAKVTAPWRKAAGTPAVANGSQWTSPNDGEVRTRTDGVWRRGQKNYEVTIPVDGVATIVPPLADTGVIFVVGAGTAEHMFGWYRATSSPAVAKYGGAAAVNMVATALTGTTGAPGDITVGVQNNLIYIENRKPASNTFKVNFLSGL